ncbi:hypothetical protein ME7_00899 [Bartonella birtlesii LL-WM9]|uniref:Uncharacterized protein n=1 Tax=Bartonella birtlesii LL-WM9 TaxID=1094552 RepID=J1IYI7_9HYPH|nr:hypothetical protein [Bartonella birtlesii]EJF76355.1 hypothetical protein ME7_00899 [Bartonella birtlesii LL-WM9]
MLNQSKPLVCSSQAGVVCGWELLRERFKNAFRESFQVSQVIATLGVANIGAGFFVWAFSGNVALAARFAQWLLGDCYGGVHTANKRRKNA